MALTLAWVTMMALSLLFAGLNGTGAAVGAAAAEGASAAVTLGLGLLGGIMFWSGLMEVMERTGLTAALSRMLRPLLYRLFPSSRQDGELARELSLNVSANLLGLGNAATPAGIRAAVRLREHAPDGAASDELCRLVVMNTASIQLLPTTVAAVRGAVGAVNAFDILPAVWITSLFSVAVGLLAERCFSRLS